MHLNTSLESAYVHFCRVQCFASHRENYFINKHNVFVYMEDRLYDSNAFCFFPKETKNVRFCVFSYACFSSDVFFLSFGKLCFSRSYVKNIVKRKLILN